MHDQAAELRQRMNSFAERAASRERAPRLVVVWGAMREVGATATAVNLAAELGQHGRRVVIVDAQPDGAATRLCRLHEPGSRRDIGPETASLVDVYRGRCSLAAAITRGAHGLRVAGRAGRPADAELPTVEEIAALGQEIANLGAETDIVVVDAGRCDSPVNRTLADGADVVLIASTAADAAVMEAYAAIKRMTSDGVGGEIAVVVSRASNAAEAENAFARLQNGCRRFLGRTIAYAGCVLEDSTVQDAGLCAAPFVVLSPRCPAARGIQQTVEYLLAALADRNDLPQSPGAPVSERHDVEEILATIGESA